MPRKPLSPRTRILVLRRDGFRCRYCGADGDTAQLEVDHIVPSVAGGPDEVSNYITACSRCNNGKGVLPVVPHCVICHSHDPVRVFPTNNFSDRLLVCDHCVRAAVNLYYDFTEPDQTIRQCPGCDSFGAWKRYGDETRGQHREFAFCDACWARVAPFKLEATA